MILDLTSDDPSVFFNISGSEDQKTFVAPSANARRWYGVLSALQDYRLTVAARGGAAGYTLAVKVPVTLALLPGGGTASQAGELIANGRTYYLVAGEAGRRLQLALATTEGKPVLSVIGLADGAALTAPGAPVAE